MWHRIYGIVSFLIGQIPSLLAFLNQPYWLSLYHPGISRGLEWFLLIPLMVGIFATWLVLRHHKAMYYIFACFLILSAFIFYVLRQVPLSSDLHAVNWILSYCAFALLVAALSRFVAEQIGMEPEPG